MRATTPSPVRPGGSSTLAGWLALGALILAGLALRLHGISGQILLDDEWHSLFYVADFPLKDLLTHMGSGATCIPLNIFQKFMLQSIGWSEMILRLPGIVAGILCLCVFPLLVGKLFSRRATIIFTILMAISPHLIFAGSFTRPYAIYLLLSFVAIHAFYMWTISGQGRYRMAYVLGGAMAIYVHLFAVIAVILPPLYVLLSRGSPWLKGTDGQNQMTSKKIIGALALCLGIAGVLLLPALVHSSAEFFAKRPRSNPPTVFTFAGFASLVAGSSNWLAVIPFCLLWLGGQAWLIRTNRLLGGMFAAITLSYAAAVVLAAPPKMDVSIQMARYCIPIFPIAFICVAVAADQSLAALAQRPGSRSRGFATGIILCAGVTLFMAGPLPRLHGSINNFMNHAAYQESYEPLQWDHPYHSQMFDYHMTVQEPTMSEFYRRLVREKEDVIVVEYPMIIGFHLNPFYFYQHFHHKRVIAGYVSNLDCFTLRSPGDAAHPNMPFDVPLSNVKDKGNLRFRNMVDLTRKEDLLKSGARYLIIHKNIFSEEMGQKTFDHAWLPAMDLEKTYRKEFGEPVFKDQWLTVFRIPDSP